MTKFIRYLLNVQQSDFLPLDSMRSDECVDFKIIFFSNYYHFLGRWKSFDFKFWGWFKIRFRMYFDLKIKLIYKKNICLKIELFLNVFIYLFLSLYIYLSNKCIIIT